MISSSYRFPKDFTDAMRDCVLAIFWPKDQIISFLKNNGCTSNELKHISKYKEQGLNRFQIIDIIFETLHSRSDGGIGQFRAMLKSLLEWEYFDPYYFKRLNKLNENEAKQKIQHLKQLQEIRDARLKESQRKRESINPKQTQLYNFDSLHDTYLELFQGKIASPQERGYKFQNILLGTASLDGLDVTEPFKGEHYIIEAKWQDKSIASEALYHFAYKVEGKMYGRGLFISVNSFSNESVAALKMGKVLRTILLDGADLIYVLEGLTTLSKVLDAKVKAAQTEGRIYIDPLTLKDK